MKTQEDEGMTLPQSQDPGLLRNARKWKKLRTRLSTSESSENAENSISDF